MRAHFTGDEGSPTFANTTTVGDYCAIASERAKFSMHTSKARKIVPHFTRREHLGNARQSKDAKQVRHLLSLFSTARVTPTTKIF